MPEHRGRAGENACERPGDGTFCAACGRNLAAVERLPTRAEWERSGSAASPAQATTAFLDAMHAAGDPGTVELPLARQTRKPGVCDRVCAYLDEAAAGADVAYYLVHSMGGSGDDGRFQFNQSGKPIFGNQ